MPLDGSAWAAGRAAALSVETETLETAALLDRLLDHPLAGRLAVVSSFGAESVVRGGQDGDSESVGVAKAARDLRQRDTGP